MHLFSRKAVPQTCSAAFRIKYIPACTETKPKYKERQNCIKILHNHYEKNMGEHDKKRKIKSGHNHDASKRLFSSPL